MMARGITLAEACPTGRSRRGAAGWVGLLVGLLGLLFGQSGARAAPRTSYPLTVTLNSDVTVLVNGLPIQRGVLPVMEFTALFYEGDVVTLEAVYDPVWYEWTGWSGDITSNEPTIRVTVDGPKAITPSVRNKALPMHNLHILGSPVFAGTPGAAVDYEDYEGPQHSETARPASGWRFAGWSGSLTSLSNPLTFTSTQDMTLVANYAPAAQTAVFYRQNFQDDAKAPFLNWHYTGEWGVIPDVTAKPGIPAGPSPDGPAGLVHNKNGDYEPNANATVTTTAIDCSGRTGVALTFLRSLTVDDFLFDQATVEVSNDGANWTTVYRNPTIDFSRGRPYYAALDDPSWYQISYDISAVADGQKTIYLRFGLKSNADNRSYEGQSIFHGWAIDDIVLSGAGPDPAFTLTPSGTTFPEGLTAYGPLPSLPGSLWQIGPAVAGGGQTRDADGDPSTPETETVGVDPGASASGEAGGPILGTAIGDNYPAGMSAPQYLQWGPLDLTGLQQTEVGFQRWLEIGSGTYDRASVQVHVATADPADPTSTDPMAPEVFSDTTIPVTLSRTVPKAFYPAATSEHYDPLAVSFTYNTKGLAAGGAEVLRLQYALDYSSATPAWVTFAGGMISTNTYDTAKPNNGAQTLSFGASAFASQTDYIKAQDNAAFALRTILTRNDGSALDATSSASVILSEVKVTGVLWSHVWDNKQASPHTEILDTAWTPVSYDLFPLGADGSEAVWVRWSLGPTDSGFSTEYGGWSLDQLQILSASNRWSATSITAPSALTWGETGEVSITLRNDGTATWDGSYRLSEVQGHVEFSGLTIPPRGDTPFVLRLPVDPADPLAQAISRWGAGSVPATGAVAPGGTATFPASIAAPPLTSDIGTQTPDSYPDPSQLGCHWALATKTGNRGVDFLPPMLNGSIAATHVVTSRFPDDGVNADGTPFWARYWIEELAGRVPMVVQGYPDGNYHPDIVVTRDQMAVYVARAKNLDQEPTHYTPPAFLDVPTDYWAYGAVEACYVAGIVSGYSDKTYRPTEQVTREQMAKYITLAADYALHAAPTTDDAPGWFTDVEVERPAGWQEGDPDPRNVFRDYIATLQNWRVVAGYLDKVYQGVAYYSYRPSEPVTRAQLAVYIWRAFVQRPGSVVALGGPGITSVPVTTGTFPYYGYADAGVPFREGPFAGGVDAYDSFLVNSSDPVSAYVTLDGARLHGRARPLEVSFALLRVTGPSAPVATHTETIDLDVLQAWSHAPDTLSVWTWGGSSPYGPPYRNVAWAIPTGLQGDYRLVVSIDGSELSRQPTISVLAPMYREAFDAHASLANWASLGQPITPHIYPVDYLAGNPSFKANPDLYEGGGSLELQGTQQVIRRLPSPGRHNLRLSLKYAQDGTLGPNESLAIDWSPDYGTKTTFATWNNLATVKGATVPARLPAESVVFVLPNGDPTADPVVIGADDNPDLAVRLSVSASSGAKVYFDTVEIDGT